MEKAKRNGFAALILLLAVVLMIMCSAAAVHAAEIEDTVKYEDFTFHYWMDEESGEATSIWLEKYEGTEETVKLPTHIIINGKEKPVLFISKNAFQGNTTAKKIIVPNGYLVIGDFAFNNCTALEEIVIGNADASEEGWFSVGESVFNGCLNLKTYVLGWNNIVNGEGKNLEDYDMPYETDATVGIGKDADGNIYAGVTAYVTAGSKIREYLEGQNTASANGNTIMLQDIGSKADEADYKLVLPKTDPDEGGDQGGNNPPADDQGGDQGGNNPPADDQGGDQGGNNPPADDQGGNQSGDQDGGTPSEKPADNPPSGVPDQGGNQDGSTPSDKSEDGSTPSVDPVTQMGEDGTPYGKGASVEAATEAATAYAGEADPKGTSYGLLQAKASKVSKKYIKVTWKKVGGAVKYLVFSNKCGKKNKYNYLTTVTGTSYTLKKLKKGTYYKFLIVAADGSNTVITTSKTIHAATAGGKVGNYKKVTTKANKNKVTLKNKKKFKLKAKAVPASRKQKVIKHRNISYESSNTKIATVNSKGIIKGLKKGKCFVYAYAQNGVCAKIKVTVK